MSRIGIISFHNVKRNFKSEYRPFGGCALRWDVVKYSPNWLCFSEVIKCQNVKVLGSKFL